MEAGQWVAFEGYDTVHECGKAKAVRSKNSPPSPRVSSKTTAAARFNNSSISVPKPPETRPVEVATPQKLNVSEDRPQKERSPIHNSESSDSSSSPSLVTTANPPTAVESESDKSGCVWLALGIVLLFFFFNPHAGETKATIKQSFNDDNYSYFVLNNDRIFQVENPGLIFEMAPGTDLYLSPSSHSMTPRSGTLKGQNLTVRKIPTLPECKGEVFVNNDGEVRYRITKSELDKMVRDSGLSDGPNPAP